MVWAARQISGRSRPLPGECTAMSDQRNSRTLLKSPPELWAECSDATALARHLDGFGEIRITRLEPETAVTWEGERVCGTVRLQPSGWGTKVILTARAIAVPSPTPTRSAESLAPSAPTVEPPTPHAPSVEHPAPARSTEPRAPARSVESPAPPVPVFKSTTDAPPDPEPRRGLFARLFGWLKAPEVLGETESESPPHLDLAQHQEPAAAAAPGAAMEAAAWADAAPIAEPRAADSEAYSVVLAAALESLGQAHHRPFSRA